MTRKKKSRRCVAVALDGGMIARVQTDTGQISPRTKTALAELAHAATTTTHRCARVGCTEEVALDRVACKTHWYELPERLRSRFTPTMSTMERALLFRQCRELLEAE